MVNLKLQGSWGIWCLFLSCSLGAAVPKIKVKIASDLQQVEIRGRDLVKRDLLKLRVKKFTGDTSIYFNCRSNQSKFKADRKDPIVVASLTSNSGLISWKDSKYKGDLYIATNSNFSGCDLINSVELDDYIASLLAKEMNSKWHMEALKAQAVAARTYAYQKMISKDIIKQEKQNVPYDIINSERYQVSGAFHNATYKTIAAAEETRGEVLVSKKTGKIIPVFYHADCGGMTYLPSEVWGINYPEYRSVRCLHPKHKPAYKWEVNISTNQWLRFLRWYKRVNKINSHAHRVRLVADKLSRGYLKVYYGDKPVLVPKSQLRRFFGHKKVPSNRFRFFRIGRYYQIKGVGRGHGVGMSQIGALYLAKDGWNYRQILHHYYPGFVIKKIY